MRIFIATLALLIGLTNANAQIAGQNDPQFKAALAQWLDGDDLAALTALSKLAKADNRAAQVFLGRMNEATHTHIHVTGPMERKARIALMRQVGGLSGKSWLKVASQDVPLAIAFMQVKVIREKSAAIGALLDMGEVTAALMPLASLVQSQETVKANELLAHPKLPEHVIYLQALVDRDAAYVAKHWPILGSARRPMTLNMKPNSKVAADALFLWEGFRWDGVEDGRSRRIIPDVFPDNMISSPYYAPLKTLCSERCESDIPNCMRAIMIHQSWKTPIWITLSGPVETLVSTSEYYKKPRVMDDLVRLIKGSSRDNPDYYKSLNQCSYQIMFKE